MGKQSKQRKRALGRAKLALRKVVELTQIFYNDTRMMNICKEAKRGIPRYEANSKVS